MTSPAPGRTPSIALSRREAENLLRFVRRHSHPGQVDPLREQWSYLYALEDALTAPARPDGSCGMTPPFTVVPDGQPQRVFPDLTAAREWARALLHRHDVGSVLYDAAGTPCGSYEVAGGAASCRPVPHWPGEGENCETCRPCSACGAPIEPCFAEPCCDACAERGLHPLAETAPARTQS